MILYPSIGCAVKLPSTGEQDSPGRHVEAHGKSLGGEECFDEALAEQNLCRLFQDRQQA